MDEVEIKLPRDKENEVLYGPLFGSKEQEMDQLEQRIEELEKMFAVFNKNWADYQEIINTKFFELGRVGNKVSTDDPSEVRSLREMIQGMQKENNEMAFKLSAGKRSGIAYQKIEQKIMRIENALRSINSKVVKLEEESKGSKNDSYPPLRPFVIE